MRPAHVRKFLVAVATAITQAIVLGLFSDPYDKYAILVLAFLGAYGVFAVPNDDLDLP